MSDDILSDEEAAAYLRIDLPRLIRISTGARPKVASIKEGNSRTYRRESLAAYAEANETPAAPAVASP